MFNRQSQPAFHRFRSMPRHLCGILLWAFLCVTQASSVRAQNPPVGDGLGGLIIADRNRARVLREAQELIAAEKYIDALTYLQRLLEEDQDLLLRPLGNDNTGVLRSMKAEVQRIIEHLPPHGREVYERNYGPAANALLKEALEQNDEDKLARVARLFYHTPAGYEATYRMGLYQFDHGEPMVAALILRRLQRTPEAAKRFEPLLSLRMALSWIRAGMPDEARAVINSLKTPGKPQTVMLAGERRDLFAASGEPSAWLAQLIEDQTAPQYANKTDWLMPGGSSRRNAVLPLPRPADSPPWHVSTVAYSEEADDLIDPVVDETLASLITQQQSLRSRQSQHLLPSRQPLVAGGMVFSRMLETVRIYDLESGDFLLQTFGWDKTLKDLVSPDDGNQIPNWRTFLGQLMNQRLWDDGTFGRLASDGERLYCVQEMGFWNPISTGREQTVIPVPTSSILYAIDLSNGKLVWDVGGPLKDVTERNLPGRFFLGPPLPMAGRLYCLVDVNQEIQLNVLNAATGELEWSQSLATPMHQTIGQDKARRTSGVSVAYSDGVLVCPTDAGATVALDLTTRSLLWGFPSEDSNPNIFDPRRGGVRQVNQPTFPILQNGWIDSTPVIYEDKVVLTPLKSNKIYLLDLLTGKRIWEQPRDQGLYVAGVTQDMVIVVGLRNVQTWNTRNDQTGWRDPLRLSAAPTGRGVIVESKLLLPAGENLLVVDLKTGTELEPIPAPGNVELGNLVVAQGRLISQSVDSLDVIPFPKLEGGSDEE
jgi:hypothetical protein